MKENKTQFPGKKNMSRGLGAARGRYVVCVVTCLQCSVPD